MTHDLLKYLYGDATPQRLEMVLVVKNSLYYNFECPRTSQSHYWFKSYGNFAEKNEFFLLDKVVKLVGEGSVINWGGAYPF